MTDWNRDDVDVPEAHRDSTWFKAFFNAIFQAINGDKTSQLSSAEAELIACTWMNCRRVYDFLSSDSCCLRSKDRKCVFITNSFIT